MNTACNSAGRRHKRNIQRCISFVHHCAVTTGNYEVISPSYQYSAWYQLHIPVLYIYIYLTLLRDLLNYINARRNVVRGNVLSFFAVII